MGWPELEILHDLTPEVAHGIPVWPGDTPYESGLLWAIDRGATVNVSSITTTPHLGAHTDAPFHTEAEGATIERLALGAYLGPCRVVSVPAPSLVEPKHLAGLDLGSPPRLLLRTGSVTDPHRFPEHASALSPRLVEALGDAGCLLVGLDSPSVDPIDSKTLDAHHALNRRGIVNLEGLALRGVKDGVYLLVALPLRLAGLDASPVRAVLCAWPADGEPTGAAVRNSTASRTVASSRRSRM